MRELTPFVKIALFGAVCFITAPLVSVLAQALVQTDWSWLLLPIALVVPLLPTLLVLGAAIVLFYWWCCWFDGLSEQQVKLLTVVIAAVVLGGLVLRVLS